MIRVIFALAFVLGVAAVAMMGWTFFPSATLALTVTAAIGTVYLIGALELWRFRKATSSLSRSLAELSEAAAERLSVIDEWLINLHPSLHHSVRQRIEGERAALPAPVLTPYLVSLLVMLGLLGTFVGLVETLKGVVVALESSTELEKIRQALTAPMGGLELAFGTSVAGVATSAMLGLMSALSRRDRVLATRELDGLIATGLRRFSLAHQRRETFKALQIQSETLPAIADKLSNLASHIERMSDRVGEQLVTSQDRLHESVKATYRELASSLSESLRQSVARTDTLLSDSARLVGEGIQPVVRQTMAAISAEIGRSVHETHERLSETVQDQLQSLSDRFAQTSEAVAHAWQRGLAAHQQSNEIMIKGLQESLGTFREDFGRSSVDMLESIDKTASGWIERQQAGEQARLDRWAETLQRAQQQGADQLEHAAAGIIGELSSASGAQQAAMASLSDELAALYAEVTTQLRVSGEQALARQRELTAALDEAARVVVDKAQAGSSRMLSEMRDLLNASEALVQARVDSEKAWLEGHDQRIGQLAATLRTELGALRDDEARRGQANADRMAALEATVATHLAGLGKALEEPMTHLIRVASETPKIAAEVIGQLRQEIANNIERDNQLLEERGRLIAELDEVSNSMAQSSAAQVAAIEQLVDASGGRLKEIGDLFSRQVDTEVAKVSEMADHFAVSAIELSSLGEAFAVAVNLYSESNNRLISSLRDIEDSLEKSSTRSDEQLGYYVAQAREVIDYSVLTQKEIFDELRQLKLDTAESYDRAEVN